jgi:hypothetical protein
MTRAEALEKFPLVNLDRLQVEMHVMDLYLDRPAWLEALRPRMTPQEREVHFAQYRARNEMLRASVRKFAEKLENSGKR